MQEIDAEIDRLEQEAAHARAAIRKTQRARKRAEAEVQRLLLKEHRTRVQHLDRPNRLLADLIDIKKEMERSHAD